MSRRRILYVRYSSHLCTNHKRAIYFIYIYIYIDREVGLYLLLRWYRAISYPAIGSGGGMRFQLSSGSVSATGSRSGSGDWRSSSAPGVNSPDEARSKCDKSCGTSTGSKTNLSAAVVRAAAASMVDWRGRQAVRTTSQRVNNSEAFSVYLHTASLSLFLSPPSLCMLLNDCIERRSLFSIRN